VKNAKSGLEYVVKLFGVRIEVYVKIVKNKKKEKMVFLFYLPRFSMKTSIESSAVLPISSVTFTLIVRQPNALSFQ